MSLSDGAVLTASVYGSFDEKRYLTKVTLVSKVSWRLIYRCRHHIHLVNVPARIVALIKQWSDMSNVLGDCGVPRSLK